MITQRILLFLERPCTSATFNTRVVSRDRPTTGRRIVSSPSQTPRCYPFAVVCPLPRARSHRYNFVMHRLSCKRNRRVRNLFRRAPRAHCDIAESFGLFYVLFFSLLSSIPSCVEFHSLFVRRPEGHFRGPGLGHLEQSCHNHNHSHLSFGWTHVFISLGQASKSGVAGSYGKCTSGF